MSLDLLRNVIENAIDKYIADEVGVTDFAITSIHGWLFVRSFMTRKRIDWDIASTRVDNGSPAWAHSLPTTTLNYLRLIALFTLVTQLSTTIETLIVFTFLTEVEWSVLRLLWSCITNSLFFTCLNWFLIFIHIWMFVNALFNDFHGKFWPEWFLPWRVFWHLAWWVNFWCLFARFFLRHRTWHLS